MSKRIPPTPPLTRRPVRNTAPWFGWGDIAALVAAVAVFVVIWWGSGLITLALLEACK